MENEKFNFKIIAIKTGDKPTRIYKTNRTDAKLDFLKNLNPNTIYSFYKNYSFPEKNFNEIILNSSVDLDLYSIKSDGKDVPIRINAIVGNNGSGKSSLIELLYWANYNIGCVSKLLRDSSNNRILKPYKFLDFEILFSTKEEQLINLIFKEGKILQQKLELKDGKITPSGTPSNIDHSTELIYFFYSIVVNYSHYALNSIEVGDWIEHLFHKNDGYQTPIVLNPMRTNGNVDINRENGLLKRRLLGNILEPIGNQSIEKSLRNIVNDKIVTKLNITYNPQKPSNKKYHEPKEPKHIELPLIVIKSIEKHFNFEIGSNHNTELNTFEDISIKYIIEKLLKISKTYRPYHKFTGFDAESLKYIDAFIKRVKESNSHIVFKVKGAIIYLKHYRRIFGDNYKISQGNFTIDAEELSQQIEIIKKEEAQNGIFLNTFSMVPPGFYDTEILLNDETSFNSLSSGEKQKIHSISSIIYHIINLNSVTEQYDNETDIYHQYPFVNIVLDEIELYYHPEWQKKYIKDLLESISNIPKESLNNIKGINITFLTHSPFILSDIPSINVLKLVKGSPKDYNPNELTFGANINDVLADSFFLNNGLIGDFAKEKIQDIIEYINDEHKRTKKTWITKPQIAKTLIEQIGEPYLADKLNDMFLESFPEFKNAEILKLEKRLNQLKNGTTSNI